MSFHTVLSEILVEIGTLFIFWFLRSIASTSEAVSTHVLHLLLVCTFVFILASTAKVISLTIVLSVASGTAVADACNVLHELLLQLVSLMLLLYLLIFRLFQCCSFCCCYWWCLQDVGRFIVLQKLWKKIVCYAWRGFQFLFWMWVNASSVVNL